MNKNISRPSGYNATLFILIFLSLIYIAVLAGNSNRTLKAADYHEAGLITSIYPGTNSSALNGDLTLIRTAINQSNQDSQIVQTGFSYKSNNSSSSELSQRVDSLSLAIRELAAVKNLNKQEQARLTAKSYALMKPLIKEESDPWEAGQTAGSLSSSQAGFVRFLQTVEILKVSDDQQVAEGLLSQLAGAITARIPSIAAKGLSTADISSDLSTMTGDTNLASGISSTVEQSLSHDSLSIPKLKAVDAKLITAGLDLSVAYKTAVSLISLTQAA